MDTMRESLLSLTPYSTAADSHLLTKHVSKNLKVGRGFVFNAHTFFFEAVCSSGTQLT